MMNKDLGPITKHNIETMTTNVSGKGTTPVLNHSEASALRNGIYLLHKTGMSGSAAILERLLVRFRTN